MARRLLVYSQQVFEWRREARAGHLALPADAVAATAVADFVPVVTDAACTGTETQLCGLGGERTAQLGVAPSIEIRLAGAVVRVAIGTDGALLTEVLRAVRAPA